MPITYVQGNILEAQVHCIINTVNCEGYMGKGLALQVKQALGGDHSKYMNHYRLACLTDELRPGYPQLYQTTKEDEWLYGWSGAGRILNFPTKQEWRKPSQLEWIEWGLAWFVTEYPYPNSHAQQYHEVAFPPLGCCYGGLDWHKQVKPLMEFYLKDLPTRITIYAQP